ncbi:MAG TPA: hypothetical protein VKX25_22450 [Bryobacteraceae bacterium]|jgi:hypothetical protein|nr:hypothetical protein [Bryobacteraceae bacterium]
MNGEQHLDDEDRDLGEPIHELRELAQETPGSFLLGVRKKVHRRTSGSYLVAFAFETPPVIGIEMLKLMKQILTTLGKRNGG